MDIDAKRIELENQKAAIEGYLQHPVTKEVLHDLKQGQEALIITLCNFSIVNLETFFGHFEAIGHLRGLRQTESLIKANLDEVKEQIRRLDG